VIVAWHEVQLDAALLAGCIAFVFIACIAERGADVVPLAAHAASRRTRAKDAVALTSS
jgi:hypothetical protein